MYKKPECLRALENFITEFHYILVQTTGESKNTDVESNIVRASPLPYAPFAQASSYLDQTRHSMMQVHSL